jgi:superfamily II DNA or RNA helicase
MTKDELRIHTGNEYDRNQGFLAVYHATGTGKSSASIECMRRYRKKDSNGQILVVCHSTNARDETWPKEIAKWGSDLDITKIRFVCYKGLMSIRDTNFGMIVMDEAHYITDLSYEFFNCNTYQSIVVLTATEPEEEAKLKMLHSLTKGNSIYYDVDQAIDAKMLNDFELIVFMVPLDNKLKYLKVNRFNKKLHTEFEFNEYIESVITKSQKRLSVLKNQMLEFVGQQKLELEEDSWKCLFKTVLSRCRSMRMEEIDKLPIDEQMDADVDDYPLLKQFKNVITEICSLFETIKWKQNERMHFIYNLKSKLAAGKYVAKQLREKNRRFLMICSNKAQADEMSQYRFYSGIKKTDYKRFKDKELNEIASCKQISEGENIDGLDAAIIVQMLSKSRHLVQRIGRLLRREVGFISRGYIIVAEGTQDEVWYNNATSKFKQEKIKKVKLEI